MLRWAVEGRHFGLILAAKPDSAKQAIKVITEVHRENFIRHVTHRSGHIFKPIEWAMKSSGDNLPLNEALEELWGMLEIIDRGQVSAEAHNFYGPAQKEMLQKVMRIV